MGKNSEGVRFQLTNKKKRTTAELGTAEGAGIGTSLQLLLSEDGGDSLLTNNDASARRSVSSFSQEEERDRQNQPLVIPVTANRLKWKTTENVNPPSPSSAPAPAEVPSHEHNFPADIPLSTSSSLPQPVLSLSTASNGRAHDPNDDEAQYRRDVNELPEAMTLDDYRKPEAVPIEQFGAALLRGMGWKEGEEPKSKKDAEPALPRPHRLGLGAIPKAAALPTNEIDPTSSRRGPRRPDQVEQDRRRQEQLREFERQREEQRARDRQITIQDGSVVLLLPSGNATTQRARIAQLAGVPGLNRVRVEIEGTGELLVVSRSDLGGLVSRDELDRRPFAEPDVTPRANDDDRRKDDKRRDRSSRRLSDLDNEDRSQRERRGYADRDSRRDREKGDSRKRHRTAEHDDDSSDRRRRKKRSGRDESSSGSASYSRRREEDSHRRKRRDARELTHKSAPKRSNNDTDDKVHHSSSRSRPKRDAAVDAWLVPHIRVRVVTSKLGKHYFQQKGVVVDVTPKGVTLRMDPPRSGHGSSSVAVLDNVPARYLTTALPKVQGCAVVVQGPHKGARGVVLQRDSNRAILQLDEDHTILTLSPDDLAEWCGPRDSDF